MRIIVTMHGTDYPFAVRWAKKGTPMPQFKTPAVAVAAAPVNSAASAIAAAPAPSALANAAAVPVVAKAN